ncbi:MAG: ABC transporter transmembrane domain-containing protein, partial [Pseudomonadota bacterium]
MRLFFGLLERLGGLIDPFRTAEGPPPSTLWAFVKWCLAGAWPIVILSAVLSGVAGLMEVAAAWLLGTVVDSAVAGAEPGYLAQNIVLIVGYIAFYLLLRPLFFGVSAAFSAVALPPNLMPLILSRLHRWTLGHDVTFFDNDFAGRIAQKQMQTAAALVNVISEVINAATFAVATLIGAVILLVAIDWRVGAALLIWLAAYSAMMTWFLPRIRSRAEARAA